MIGHKKKSLGKLIKLFEMRKNWEFHRLNARYSALQAKTFGDL